jgi:hypothetical protein
MIRFPAIIVLSIAAGLLIHNTSQKDAPATPPDSAATPDIAKDLRTISGAPAPEKLWARDFAAYASARPGQWIVAQCKEPCLSESEAANQAHSDAARSIWPIILSRFSTVPADIGWLRRRVEADVAAGRLDADKLAEKFDRPYGAVWTEAILIDVSPARIDSLMNSYKSDRARFQRQQTRWHEILFIAIAAAWIAYFLVNSITKGYFTCRLRLAAAIATVLGVALLA